MTEWERMDLHTHSNRSDGDAAPGEVVRFARAAGVSLLSVTDHDSLAGVAEAMAAGQREGVTVVPGVEIDNRFSEELHILGLGVDIGNAPLLAALERAKGLRAARNAEILRRLRDIGCDVAPYLSRMIGVVTRLHIALALVSGGHAADTRDAFARYLRRGTVGDVPMERPAPEETIRLIRGAGGIAVLAHPCHLKGNVHAAVREMVALGLGGIEVYYPSSAPGQTALFLSLAAQHGLLATCGSDYHGAHRPSVKLGCAWTDAPVLEETRRALLERL